MDGNDITTSIDKQVILEAIEDIARFKNNDEKKLCERFFPKGKNKNFLTSIAIVIYMLKHKTGERSIFSKKDILELGGDEENKDNKITYDDTLVSDALKVLRCNKILSYEDRATYKLNESLWYKGVRYKIKDFASLKSLIPLMVAYIKHDIRYMPNDFFKLLTPLNQFLLQPTSFHNSNFEVEKYIYNVMSQDGGTIKIKTDKGPRAIVYPLGIVFEGEVKKLEFRNEQQSSQTFTTNLSNVIFTPKKSSITSKQDNVIVDTAIQTMTVINQKVKVINDEISVVMAVSAMAYEYFDNITVLDNMLLLTDSREIRDYLFENKIELSKIYASSEHQEALSDFFLVTAKDSKEQILDVILKNINHVKVLSPSTGELEKAIEERFKIFQKNAKISTEKEEWFPS